MAFTCEIQALAGVRERAVEFESGGERLRGVLSLPGVPPPLEGGGKGEGYQPRVGGRHPPPKPSPSRGEGLCARGVVILHGWGTYRAGPHDMLVKLARELAAKGTPSLRFDLRARGESTGEPSDIGLDEMIDDARRAAGFLRDETGVAAVDAVGLCSGANVALGAAAAEGVFERVAALSALPFQSHKSAMQSLRRTRGRFFTLLWKALHPLTWWRLITGKVHVFKIFRYLFAGEGGKVKTASGETRNLKDSSRDLMGALAGFGGELLFVWGGADAEGMGAKSHFEEFARANSLDARFEVVEGSNHNFYSLRWEREVFDMVGGFLSA